MIATVLEGLSSSLLLPIDQISAALCLILSFPFAFLLHWSLFALKSSTFPCRRVIVNALAVGPTYFFLWVCFYVARSGGSGKWEKEEEEKVYGFLWDMLSVHLPILTTFLALKYSKFMRKNPTALFALLLAQLSYHHITRQLNFYNQYTVNVTGPLMVLVIKLSAFAYDVHDGKIAVETVGIGSFLSWCLMFAGFFTGPVVHYQEFEAFCTDPKLFIFKKNDSEERVKTKIPVEERALSGRKRRASFLILSASLLLLFGLLLQPHFPTQSLLQVSQSTETSSLAYRLLFMHLSLLSWRIKYYVAWLLAEGALVIIGFGFIVKDKKIKW